MKQGWIGLGIALALGSLAGAGSAEAAFERAPLSARDAGLGGGRASARGGAFGNPAGVGAGEGGGPAAEVTLGRPFGVPGLREEQASVSWAGGKLAASVGYRSFGYRSAGSEHVGRSTYAEREIRLVGVRHLPGRAAVGVAVRGMAVAGAGFSARRTVAVDVGFAVRTEEVRWMAVLEAVVGELPGDPEAVGAHVAVAVEREFRLGHVQAEVGKAGDEAESYVVLGAAWRALPILTLRGGAHSARATWALGVGLQIFPAAMDLAFEGGHPLGSTVHVGLRWPALASGGE